MTFIWKLARGHLRGHSHCTPAQYTTRPPAAHPLTHTHAHAQACALLCHITYRFCKSVIKPAPY